ncbi:hypothetical protein IGS74_19045 [Aureimonas sp. OT7]|uniref:hypothetical protein n=1 Tax=Aureimonas sp. OT7 TaxID=2816454 RepID=UPI00178743EF|nr:hypothetical protein [Aureimonas sp. OT7]QOG06573.1 hypothetical protein IGS74_19045 [Aureimonas sp. OT7]
MNGADPGYTKTDFTNHSGHRTVAQAAGIIVRLATADEQGPTGIFTNEDGILPW